MGQHTDPWAYICTDFFLPTSFHLHPQPKKATPPPLLCALPESSPGHLRCHLPLELLSACRLGMIGPWAQAPQAPARKPKALVLQTWGQWGCTGLKAFQSPAFSRKGCVVGRRSLIPMLYVFPSQHSSRQLCLYKTLEERERGEGQCPRDDIILSCLLQTPTTAGRRRVRGESCRGWWTGRMVSRHAECLCVCAFIRDIISLFSAPLPPPHSRAS